jgi:hypothetical protein
MRKTRRTSVSKRGALHRIYFCSPKESTNADMLADRLIGLRLVQEVFLTDIEDGYVVKVRFTKGKEPERPDAYIARNVSRDFGHVIKG